MRLVSNHFPTLKIDDPHQSTSDPFAIARRLTVAVWVYDVDNASIVHANREACKLWQAVDEDALRARDMSGDMSSTVEKRLQQYQTDFVQKDAAFTEMWTLYPDGRPQSVMVTFRGYPLPDGRMAMLCETIGTAEDEPQNRRSTEALLHTDVMITLFDRASGPLYMNPAARNAAPNQLNSFTDLFVDLADYTGLMIELNTRGEHRVVVEVRTFGGQRWYDLSVKNCLDAATGNPAILVTAIDVSEMKRAKDTARFLADRDQLTGCYNRTYLQNQFSLISTRFCRRNSVIVFFDVDRFKLINDRYGHEVGDTVLRQIAIRARSVIRPDDIMARLGGDEFVILLENIAGPEEVSAEIERLRAKLMQPIEHEATRLNITISTGVVIFAPGTAEFAQVMREADIALYASKQGGRNQSTFFSAEMGATAKARDLIEEELKQAIAKKEFVLHYQPRVDIATGQVISVEALVRWDHPTRGLIAPGEFIPICEETGMIEELGRMVFEMGCAQAISWRNDGVDIELSLNISPRQFNDKYLLETLARLAQTPGFPRDKIELEVTENVLIGDHHLIAEKLHNITEMGYRIAIDDFGTGYSNLSYISLFPLKCIKIDRSFVSRLPETGPIIRLILTLASQIGATSVAEGVESQEQLDWLTEQKCSQVQGYFLSRPVPLSELDATLVSLNCRGKN